jgi:hypothetical protein
VRDDTANVIPKLGPKKLSAYVADLLLAGAGEGAAMKHPKTRKAWHLFFFSSLAFLAWYLVGRRNGAIGLASTIFCNC